MPKVERYEVMSNFFKKNYGGFNNRKEIKIIKPSDTEKGVCIIVDTLFCEQSMQNFYNPLVKIYLNKFLCPCGGHEVSLVGKTEVVCTGGALENQAVHFVDDKIFEQSRVIGGYLLFEYFFPKKYGYLITRFFKNEEDFYSHFPAYKDLITNFFKKD
jgi:hypothetical protein